MIPRILRRLGVLQCAAFALLLAAIPLAQAAPYVYVTNQTDGTVTVIDAANNATVATIAVGSRPVGVAVSSDGSRAYVATGCQCPSGAISVIDSATDQVIDTRAPPYSFSFPVGAVLSPDGTRLYVSLVGGNQIAVMNTALKDIIPIGVGYGPRGIALSPNGDRLYVANQCALNSCNYGTLSILDTTGYRPKLINTIPLGIGSAPSGVAVSPDGKRIYVADEYSFTVSVIDAATDKVIATVPVGPYPIGLAVSPDGTHVYVANWGVNTVSVINTSTNQVTNTIVVGNAPTDVSFTPDGTRAYVTNDLSQTVSIINTATETQSGTINVGRAPFPIGPFIGPGVLIAYYSETSGPAGTQESSTLPALTNPTTCATTDIIVKAPTHGQLDLSAATGQFTYTPNSATYSGPDLFLWRGEAPTSCTAADNPTKPLSRVATASITLNPVITGLSSITVDKNQSAQESLSLTGSPPFTITLASNNTKLLPISDLTLKPANCGAKSSDLDCTVSITPTSGMTGQTSVTFVASDAYGDSVKKSVLVSVTSSGSNNGGGGGGLNLLSLFGLLGLSVVSLAWSVASAQSRTSKR